MSRDPMSNPERDPVEALAEELAHEADLGAERSEMADLFERRIRAFLADHDRETAECAFALQAECRGRLERAEAEADAWRAEYLKVVGRYDDVLTDLQGQFAQLTAERDRALGEAARLRGTAEDAAEALTWASGSASFSPGGEADKGWATFGRPALDRVLAALASPLSENAGAVLGAAEDLVNALDAEDHAETMEQVREAETANEVASERLIGAVRALRAELAREGGG